MFGNAASRIRDGDGHVGDFAALDAAHFNENVAFFGELHRIAHEIGDDLAQAPGVADKGLVKVRIVSDKKLKVFLVHRNGQQRRDIFNAFAQPERFAH